MASTISPANLTVSLTTNITLNNKVIATENNLTISGVNEVDTRIVTVPSASEITLMKFGSAPAAGTFIAANVKYIQIVNKDTANFIRLRLSKTGGVTFDVKIDAGKFFILGNVSESVSESGAAFAAFQSADTLSAQADTADVDIEYFIAST